MKYDLQSAVKAQGRTRRASIELRPIKSTQAQADELARILVRAPALWQAAEPRIVAAYARTLGEMGAITDSPADIERELGSIADEITRLLFELTPALRDWSLRQERYVRGRWQANVLSAAGVDLTTVIGPADMRDPLAIWLERNLSLVRSVSDDTRARIGDIVFRGLNARTPARDVAKEISEATGMGRRRAQRIASDQAAKLTASLADERRRQAGVEQWKWRHSGKLHPREEHIRRDGKLYSDGKPPADMPGQLPFCGCVQQPVLMLD